jgi:hypothetical protein
MMTWRALIDDFAARFGVEIESRIRGRLLAALAADKGGGPGTARLARSAAVSPSRRRQGQYIGLLRSLNARARARVQAAARKEGVPAALRLARQLKRA